MRAMKNTIRLMALAAIASVWPAESHALRLVSYNVHHCRGMDDKVDVARTAAAIAREKPDFAGIQEVDRNVKRSGCADQAKELARLTGGAHVSEVMLSGAEELLLGAETFKKSLI